MSDDLIRRSDVINHCEVWRERAKEKKDRDGWWMADNLLRLMKDTPTAEPKSGEWILSSDGYGYIGNPVYRCSVCGWWDEQTPYNFCPNCGADMRGENNETDKEMR